MMSLVTVIQNVFGLYMPLVIVVAVCIIIVLLCKQWYARGIIGVVGLCIMIWARYIEPFDVQVNHTIFNVGFTGRYVLISDLHLGKHKKQEFLIEIVDIINQITDIDAVLIAGDFMLDPRKEDITQLYQPLAHLTVPVYAVLGNHDIELPGPAYRDELVDALTKYGVDMIDNQIRTLDNGTILVGMGDYMGNEDDVTLLDQFTTKDNIIVLVHNPDTVTRYTNTHVDLTLAGHTHCGQIKIPLIRKWIVPVVGPYLCGYYQTPHTQLYISTGLGETALPMRLFNHPTIDVIELE